MSAGWNASVFVAATPTDKRPAVVDFTNFMAEERWICVGDEMLWLGFRGCV